MTHFELFKATVAHEPHDEFLFRAEFTPGLGSRL